MKKLILAASALALMSGAALASNDGVVAKYNSEARVITVDNGKSYTVPRDVALPSISTGEKVTILLNGEGDRVTTVLKSL